MTLFSHLEIEKMPSQDARCPLKFHLEMEKSGLLRCRIDTQANLVDNARPGDFTTIEQFVS